MEFFILLKAAKENKLIHRMKGEDIYNEVMYISSVTYYKLLKSLTRYKRRFIWTTEDLFGDGIWDYPDNHQKNFTTEDGVFTRYKGRRIIVTDMMNEDVA